MNAKRLLSTNIKLNVEKLTDPATATAFESRVKDHLTGKDVT